MWLLYVQSKPEIVEASAQQRNTDKANNSEINTKNIQVVQEQLSTVDNSEEESDLSPPSYHSSPYLPSYDEIAGANHEGAESLPQCTNVKYRLYHFRVYLIKLYICICHKCISLKVSQQKINVIIIKGWLAVYTEHI